MSNPRVLKAHREAVEDMIPRDAAHIIARMFGMDVDTYIEQVAYRILSSTDDNTKYVVIVREPQDRGVTVYGPYSAAGANAAIESGDAQPLAFEGARLGVFPLTPAPKRRRVSKKTGSNA